MPENKGNNFFNRLFTQLTPRKEEISNTTNYVQDLSGFDDIITKLGSLFSNRSFMTGQFANRIQLYNDYEYILKRIPETSKALNLIISYILKPDVIEEQSLLIDDSDKIIHDIQKNFIQYLNIEQLLQSIVNDFLLYGDAYVKVSYVEVEVDTSKSLNILEVLQQQNKQKYLYESDQIFVVLDNMKQKKQIKEYRVYDNDREFINGSLVTKFDGNGLNIITENIHKQNSNNNLKKYFIPYKLTIINPKRVIKMEEFNINGYLVLPEKYQEQFTYSVDYLDANVRKILFDNVYSAQEIVNNIQRVLKTDSKYVVNTLEIVDEEKLESDNKILFYPISSGIIFNFSNIMSTQNYPYGTSILSQSREIQYYVILLELSTLIYKINRSTERRLIRIPVDSVPPEKRASYIETIKQKFKTNISISSDGQLSDSQQILSILDDYFVPIMNGTPLYEIDILQGGSNVEAFSNELDYFNKKIISTLNIPPDFFFNEGQGGTKLLQQDELFARLIDRYQSLIEITFNKMLYNMFTKCNIPFDNTTSKIVKLPRPVFFSKLLYYEIQSAKIDYQTKLRDIVEDLPPEYILKKLLDFTDDDIDELNTYKQKEQSKEILQSSTEEEV